MDLLEYQGKQFFARYGIPVSDGEAVTTVDDAQYNLRQTDYDFDMTWIRRAFSLSPGNEQRLYWGSEAADTSGVESQNEPVERSLSDGHGTDETAAEAEADEDDA